MKKALLFTSVFAITVLTVALLFILPASAETVGGNCGKDGDNVTWSLDTETGLFTVSGSGEMDHFSYADSNPWQNYRSSIKTVIIEEGVTNIGSDAFKDCTQLKKLVLASTITDIGEVAFENCTALESLVIPHGVLRIETHAFADCQNLTSVFIADTVTTLKDGAFRDCAKLETLVIPNSVTYIGRAVLDGCESLTALTFPAGRERSNATNYNCHFFGYIFGAGSVYSNKSAVPKSLKLVVMTSMSSKYQYFYECENIEVIVFPHEVWDITGTMFEKCKGLKTVVLPVTFKTSKTSIGYNAFLDCDALTRVEYHGTNDQWNALTFEEGNDVIKNNVVFTSCTHTYWKAVDETHHQSVCACGAVLGDPVEHTWQEGEALLTSTHLQAGKVLHTCDCNQFKIVSTEKIADHNWNDGVITLEPTVDAEGVKTFTCACGETKTEKLAKLSSTSNDRDGGCGSVVSGGLGMVALIALASTMIVSKKKK